MEGQTAWHRKVEVVLEAAALGAAAMYFYDPDRGRRRRALVRDKARHLQAEAGCAIGTASRDLNNRWKGMRARLRHFFLAPRQEGGADPQVIIARLRARLGRVVSNPHSIRIVWQDGRFILSGPILATEKPRLLLVASRIPGLIDIEDRLSVHERPDGVAGLQGAVEHGPLQTELPHENWSPALRAMAIFGGTILGSYGLARRAPVGIVLAVAGGALCARGITNAPLARLRDRGEDKISRESSRDAEGTEEPAIDVRPQASSGVEPAAGQSVH